jgi:hypothetical protein
LVPWTLWFHAVANAAGDSASVPAGSPPGDGTVVGGTVVVEGCVDEVAGTVVVERDVVGVGGTVVAGTVVVERGVVGVGGTVVVE